MSSTMMVDASGKPLLVKDAAGALCAKYQTSSMGGVGTYLRPVASEAAAVEMLKAERTAEKFETETELKRLLKEDPSFRRGSANFNGVTEAELMARFFPEEAQAEAPLPAATAPMPAPAPAPPTRTAAEIARASLSREELAACDAAARQAVERVHAQTGWDAVIARHRSEAEAARSGKPKTAVPAGWEHAVAKHSR